MTLRRTPPWSPSKSAELYGIRRWGRGHFDIDAQGDVVVKADIDGNSVAVSLPDIIDGLKQRGHAMPLLLRIENLLDERIALINETFRTAIGQANYGGEYRGVFPVKVNQQRQVVEEIVQFGQRYGLGLEAGSKAELVLALSLLPENGQLVLNGYKDREFIDLGLWATKLGYRCFFVIESPAELPLLLQRSAELNIIPQLGVRVKISARVGGLWTETSGDRSSFGLSTPQLITVIDQLKQQQKLSWLRMLHCHFGSQLPDLEQIKTAIQEAACIYAGLVSEGAPMDHIDFGGGLAVDYTGAQTNHVHSRNYTLDDYCTTLVTTLKGTFDPLGVAHPHIVTESGRATVAHTSLLLFNILNVMPFEPQPQPIESEDPPPELLAEPQQDTTRSEADAADIYQRSLSSRDKIRQDFRDGRVSLRQRAQGEDLFLHVAGSLAAQLTDQSQESATLAALRRQLAHIYYGNFSVFQSLPDSWAIDQLFPIMPIHRHCHPPEHDAIISDLTCDCDGKLDRFILGNGESDTLPVHPLKEGEEYLIGVFLMGAYQETMGDLHNLLGDTHVASIRINSDGSFDLVKEISGDCIAEVLSYVEYRPEALLDRIRQRAELGVRNGQLTIGERQQFLDQFTRTFRGYTYFRT
mgnify:FL=1